MNEIKCPNCGTMFKIDEEKYLSIVRQVRNSEFNNDLKRIEEEHKRDRESAIRLAEEKIKNEYTSLINKKEIEINDLENKIKSGEDSLKNKLELHYQDKMNKDSSSYKDLINKQELTINELNNKIALMEKDVELKLKNAINEKDVEIASLNNKIEVKNQEYLLKEKSLKESYEDKLKDRDEQIAYYKDFKARQSTKMIGESLEVHCSNEFNMIRPLFKNAYFEKDNDCKSGSKGDFIFRDYDDDHTEFVSIMFEMKNEADTTATKHKNDDFLKELDKDRREKKCEYAVLVSLLEVDNDLYNNGIVDMSHKYEKMYVIRPQFFIPLITLIRNLAQNSLQYKKELQIIQNQNIDISHFEENMNNFKEGFSRNYRIASDKFKKAIEEIDKTIDHLQKTKDALLSSENNLRLANNKAEELTIKKLTKNSEVMKKLFEEESMKKSS